MLVKTPWGRRTPSICSSGKRLPELVLVPSPSSPLGNPGCYSWKGSLGQGRGKAAWSHGWGGSDFTESLNGRNN